MQYVRHRKQPARSLKGQTVRETRMVVTARTVKAARIVVTARTVKAARIAVTARMVERTSRQTKAVLETGEQHISKAP